MDFTPVAKQNLLFECITGSKAYGMATETSDDDFKGVFMLPPEYAIGGMYEVEQVELGRDHVIYELDKFVKLAIKCNPTIIELLFTPDENIRVNSESFQILRNNADLFLSKRVKYTFCGYAMAQLKKIRGHHKWLNNPQPAEPPRISQFCKLIKPDGKLCTLSEEDFDLLNSRYFLAATHGNYIFRVYEHPDFMPGVLSDDGFNFKAVDIKDEKLRDCSFVGTLVGHAENYKQRHAEWNQYWNWKNTRNPVRAALEERSGYDTKHAAHLVRLMRMAKEILTTGQVIVKRPDAQELLAIRRGSTSYDELIRWADEQDAELQELVKDSKLPHSVDLTQINALITSLKVDRWYKSGFLRVP